MKHIATLALVLSTVIGSAQSGYVFEQTTAPYSPLAASTPCVFDANGFDEITELDGQAFSLLGFPYTAGSPYSMVIGDWGFLRFDGPTTAVIIDGLFTAIEPVDATSNVTYAIDGTPGAYILTAQWNNWHLTNGPVGNYASYQIMLEQATGIITIHIGPNSGGGMVYTNASGPNCGIFRANSSFTTCLQKLWIEVDPADPNLDSLANFDFDALHALPATNTVYRLVPATVIGIADLGTTSWQAFVADNDLIVRRPGNVAGSSAQLFNASGALVLSTFLAGVEPHIPLDGLAPGAYVLHVKDGDRPAVFRFVKP